MTKFMAGEHQSKTSPLGINNDFIERGFANIGVTIMGRNMLGPIRGEWPDENWKGWWGSSPGYRHPVFVLTHYPRLALDMGNETVFHFVTSGIREAFELTGNAADGKDVRIGGGPYTIQQFTNAGLLDELHVARIPVKLNAGEKLLSNPASQLAGYVELPEVVADSVLHARYVRI